MEWLIRIQSSAVFAMRFVQKRIVKYVAPKLLDEDTRRQEYILNIILLTSIILLSILEATVIHNLIAFGSFYDGIPLVPFTLILLVFIILLVLSNKGFVKITSWILVAIYMIGAIYCGYRWGASLPATLLTTTLVIFTSSVLIGTGYGMILSIVMVATLFLLGIHEYRVLGVQPWKYLTISTTDVITYSGIFFFITMLSWLSNRQIELSLKRARKSEQLLKNERDNLETIVAERTESLKKIQLEQMNYLSRSAEFGKLSQGLFHDLMTPLTSITLGLDLLGKSDSPEIGHIRESVKKTVEASQKMNSFMSSVRKTIKYSQNNTGSSNRDISVCNVELSFKHVIEILGYKIRNANVQVLLNQKGIQPDTSLILNKKPVDIERILLNLISNAIDSFEKNENQAKKIVKVSIGKSTETGVATMSILDNGCGIPQENLQKVFEPFFTTRIDAGGSGIGLATVKSLVEENLSGKVSLTSEISKGTEILITFQD